MNEKFPAQSYKENVLADCFEDAKHYFLEAYIAVDYAHAIMLAEQDIITKDELNTLLKALNNLDLDEIRRQTYDGSFEYLFYLLQRKITENCDDDADPAGKLHTLIYNAMRDANRAVALFASTLESAEFNLDILKKTCRRKFYNRNGISRYDCPQRKSSVQHFAQNRR